MSIVTADMLILGIVSLNIRLKAVKIPVDNLGRFELVYQRDSKKKGTIFTKFRIPWRCQFLFYHCKNLAG